MLSCTPLQRCVWHAHPLSPHAPWLATPRRLLQVILPLYPQFSISTSGSSLRLIEALFKGDPAFGNLQHTVIPSWCADREGGGAAPPGTCLAQRMPQDAGGLQRASRPVVPMS